MKTISLLSLIWSLLFVGCSANLNPLSENRGVRLVSEQAPESSNPCATVDDSFSENSLECYQVIQNNATVTTEAGLNSLLTFNTAAGTLDYSSSSTGTAGIAKTISVGDSGISIVAHFSSAVGLSDSGGENTNDIIALQFSDNTGDNVVLAGLFGTTDPQSGESSTLCGVASVGVTAAASCNAASSYGYDVKAEIDQNGIITATYSSDGIVFNDMLITEGNAPMTVQNVNFNFLSLIFANRSGQSISTSIDSFTTTGLVLAEAEPGKEPAIGLGSNSEMSYTVISEFSTTDTIQDMLLVGNNLYAIVNADGSQKIYRIDLDQEDENGLNPTTLVLNLNTDEYGGNGNFSWWTADTVYLYLGMSTVANGNVAYFYRIAHDTDTLELVYDDGSYEGGIVSGGVLYLAKKGGGGDQTIYSMTNGSRTAVRNVALDGLTVDDYTFYHDAQTNVDYHYFLTDDGDLYFMQNNGVPVLSVAGASFEPFQNNFFVRGGVPFAVVQNNNANELIMAAEGAVTITRAVDENVSSIEVVSETSLFFNSFGDETIYSLGDGGTDTDTSIVTIAGSVGGFAVDGPNNIIFFANNETISGTRKIYRTTF